MNKKKAIKEWVKWLEVYGAEEFCKAFVRDAHGAESTCVHCHQKIYLDILEGGGIADWKTSDGDYGCGRSPDTGEEGTGSHVPKKLKA